MVEEGYIEQYQYVIEESLRGSLELGNVVEPLRTAVRYSVFPGGKRVRPALSLLLNSELGGNPAEYSGAAISLELIHCSSLVHDDLPGMDNDDMRRGRPSCHKAFGEATAILVGDFLVSLASRLVMGSSFPAELLLRMTEELMNAYCELCSGQQMDLMIGEGRPSLLDIHRKKTGALFGAVFAMAVSAAGHSRELAGIARSVGVKFGVCFQLLDDYLDVYGTDQQRGRVGSSDKRKGKNTYFSDMPLERAKKELEAARSELEQAFNVFESNATKIPATRDYIERIRSRYEIKQ